MSSVNKDGEVDDEELCAYIYQTSHTAKLFREKKEPANALVVVASSSYQTHRKSPRLLATKSKQQDIPTAVVPEKPTSNTNITIKERSKRKRESTVLKEENVTVKQRVKRKRKKYTCMCSHKVCTNHVQKGGVCLRHGAEKRTCSHGGCTNHVQKGGVCLRHGANVKTCKHDGCTNHVQAKGVCSRHGAKVRRCKYE